MKKTLVTLAMILVALTTQLSAMSLSSIRTNARFLSDRMAYELNLTPMQYDDCYEINFDFIYGINDFMDDVVYGYGDAIDHYYRMLDYRNEDLRYVLNATQYARFLALEYFYRPIYTAGRSWAFRIHSIYSNHSFYYYSAPSIYHSYRGAHSHLHYHNDYYVHRHHHDIHRAPAHIHGTPHFQEHGRHDFGTVRRDRPQARPHHDRPQARPNDRPQHDRPQARPQESRPSRSEGARPNRSEGARSQSRHERSNNSGTRAGGNNGGGRHEGGRNGHDGNGRGRR